MAEKIFIEFDDLDKILNEVKYLARHNFANDSYIKQIISDIFFEIDRRLLTFEERYKNERL